MQRPKNKKPGQQYVKKELLERGWTEELIEAHLTRRQKGSRFYYRAAEVAEQEANPGISVELAKNLERLDELNRYKSLSPKARREAIEKAAARLAAAYEKADIPDHLLDLCRMIHNYFLNLVKKIGGSNVTMFLTGKELRAEYLSIAREGIQTCKKAAYASWLLGYNDFLRDILEFYPQALVSAARHEISTLEEHGVTDSVDSILAVPAVQQDFPDKPLYYCYLVHYVPESISHQLSEILEVDPKNEYPGARCMNRKFYIHVGGTNTGKTYQGIQRLKEAASGVYLAPLRLLALEIQETLLESGVVCSMLTGEEEDIRPGATHISSTVEKLDVNRRYDVAVIDECQMIGDSQRGFAWTRAILGVQAMEIHLCVAPEGLKILKTVLKDLGEPYEVIEHERRVPLLWQKKNVVLGKAQPGDAFVAFSKREVLRMAEFLRKKGTPASVIYGDLPYATRRQQMQRFLDGETKLLVATDAIGMGLNLPIQRVIFTADEKFDGIEKRPLLSSEVRQIAGRAGRFGKYDKGYAAAFPGCSGLEEKLQTMPDPVGHASLGFSDLVLRIDHPLSEVLRVWNRMSVKRPYVRMDISRYIYIISIIEGELKLQLSKEDLLRAGNIPFDEKNEALLNQFRKYIKAYARGDKEVEKPVKTSSYLPKLETYYKMLDLYYSFSKTYGMEYDKEWLSEEKLNIADKINELLIHDLSTKGSCCRKCGAHIPIDSGYGICQSCYQKQFAERRFAFDDEF